MSVPKLRFPDFSGPVLVKSLGDISQITTGRLDANAMREDGSYVFFTCAKETYKIDKYAFDTEALLISGNGANVGYIHYYSGKFNAYQRTYVVDKFLENIKFVEYFLQKNLKARIFSEVKEGNTPYIVKGTLADMNIYLPSLPEQQKITSFLSSVDKKIDLLRQKKSELELYKKGLMQKIFSQEVRFKQDDGSDFPDWEDVTLDDVLSNFSSGKSKASVLVEQGIYNVIDMGGVSSNSEIVHAKFTNHDIDVLDVGQLIMPKDDIGGGNIIGKVVFIPSANKYVLGDHVYCLTPDPSRVFSKFLFYRINSYEVNVQFRKKANGTAQLGLGKSAVLSQVVNIPILAEQQKIASFLSAIDSKIQNTSAQIEQMETFKKGLLQQMFV